MRVVNEEGQINGHEVSTAARVDIEDLMSMIKNRSHQQASLV